MDNKFSAQKIQFNIGLSPKMQSKPREPEDPFIIGVLGDFSGRASRQVVQALGERRVWRVDCDNFNKVFTNLHPKLTLNLPGLSSGNLSLSFSSLEDFHPDQLIRRIPSMVALMEQRKRLLNPATSSAAATELQALLNPLAQPAGSTDAPQATNESDADTMARLLGGAAQAPVAVPKRSTENPVERILREAVKSSTVPSATPQQTALLSVVEIELSRKLRSLLHHPQFQALEVAWRGMDLLVRNFGGDENLKLCLVDVSKEELLADLHAQQDLASTGLWKILERQAEEASWALWIGLYTFGEQPTDFETLARLAKIGAQMRAPFFAGACPSLVGCGSFGAQSDPDLWKQQLPPEAMAAWDTLRKLPEGRFAGLVLPRFLLRLPYGRKAEAIDSFAFEEFSAESNHEDYLWGNPAILAAYLVASAFQSDGWDMQPGSGGGEIGDLPAYQFTEAGESKVKPCAEAWLGERACQVILNRGLIPVLSVKGRDAVKLLSLQSITGSELEFG